MLYMCEKGHFRVHNGKCVFGRASVVPLFAWMVTHIIIYEERPIIFDIIYIHFTSLLNFPAADYQKNTAAKGLTFHNVCNNDYISIV